MPNALIYCAIRARHLLSHVFNTGSGGVDIFEVKLTFVMLTVRGQQHSFSTHERLSLWKCQSFWDRKCFDLRGTRTPNFRIHAECSNLLSYQGQTFAVPYFLILALALVIWRASERHIYIYIYIYVCVYICIYTYIYIFYAAEDQNR